MMGGKIGWLDSAEISTSSSTESAEFSVGKSSKGEMTLPLEGLSER